MRAGWVLVLAALAAGLTGGAARAQQVLFRDPYGTGAEFDGERLFVLPLEGPDGRSAPVILRSDEPAFPGAPELPPLFPNPLAVDLGFQYLRPHFNQRAVALGVPGSATGSFPVLAQAQNLSNDFGFVPQLAAAYDFPDLGFGLSASGRLMSLTGSLSRTSESSAGTGILTAQGTVNIAYANFLEGSKVFTKANTRWLQDKKCEDCRFVLTVGGRYAHVDQTFTANLASGPNQASVTATQKYNGFGPTTSLGGLCPLGNTDLQFYWFTRGSFLIGTNTRDTHTSLALAGLPGSGGTKLTESRTVVSPAGEFELGLAYGVEVGKARGDLPPPLVWLKVGGVVNVWGNLGLLSITDGPQQFSDGSLFLYGFSVMLGFQR